MYVKVVNSVWNGNGFVTRKKAERLVAEGRAVFLGSRQLRLTNHPKNETAARRAAEGYEMARVLITEEHLRNLPMVGKLLF